MTFRSVTDRSKAVLLNIINNFQFYASHLFYFCKFQFRSIRLSCLDFVLLTLSPPSRLIPPQMIVQSKLRHSLEKRQLSWDETSLNSLDKIMFIYSCLCFPNARIILNVKVVPNETCWRWNSWDEIPLWCILCCVLRGQSF